MDPMVVKMEDLVDNGNGYDFEGYLYGGARTSIIFVDRAPGEGPLLHKHPYEEIFIILEGQATYTVGDLVIEAKAGQILIGPAGVPHKFVNTGTGRLKQVDIHVNDRFVTEWLE
ncbi:MAG: cupin domain-containing protein [Chloroflexia bacterium]